MQRIVVF